VSNEIVKTITPTQDLYVGFGLLSLLLIVIVIIIVALSGGGYREVTFASKKQVDSEGRYNGKKYFANYT
jgi:hypothetical protein